eukprot:UN15688
MKNIISAKLQFEYTTRGLPYSFHFAKP